MDLNINIQKNEEKAKAISSFLLRYVLLIAN